MPPRSAARVGGPAVAFQDGVGEFVHAAAKIRVVGQHLGRTALGSSPKRMGLFAEPRLFLPGRGEFRFPGAEGRARPPEAGGQDRGRGQEPGQEAEQEERNIGHEAGTLPELGPSLSHPAGVRASASRSPIRTGSR